MFSGIVEELGVVRKIVKQPARASIEIEAAVAAEDTKVGDSIAVDGVCLTVARKEGNSLMFDAIPETLRCTTLGGIKTADKVNLERSLKVGDRIGGHFVTGHVDCVGVIRSKRHVSRNLAFEIAFPVEYARYAIPKGSIAVDGISLTLAGIRSNTVSVYIIPHTLVHTTLGFKGPSHKVNLEFDMLAKRR